MAKVPSKIQPIICRFLLLSLKPICTSQTTQNPINASEPGSNDPKPDNLDLPPPHDPFKKNMQEVFHKMRRDGLTSHAIKMFDELSKNGFTHEALDLFSIIRNRGVMPDVVAHTAVIEAYVTAGGAHYQDAIKVYEKMVASGVVPNAYTYMVLIKGLCNEKRLEEASKYLIEMVARGMRPNCGTYMSVFEAYVAEEKLIEGRELLEELKERGFTLDEKTFRENTVKRGHAFKHLVSMLSDK